MDRLNQMRVFVTVVDKQSFTRAADALGMAKSTVSRQVSDLEARLGVRLLYRTTRVLHPTEVGRAYFERCQAILRDIEEADDIVSARSEGIRGTLKVASASMFSTMYLVDPIASFRREHPDVTVDLRLDDRFVNLVEDGLDLAIRVIETPPDSSLVARRLAATTHRLVAAPSFLAAHPIHGPDDLARVPTLVRTPPAPVWTLWEGDREHRIEPRPVLACNQAEPLVHAARIGLGVGLFPDFMTHDLERAGELVRVLPELSGWSSGVYAIYPHRRLLQGRVRAFIDHLAACWEPPPWES
ncbi:MAG: LysR family transcriptional regulator [Myxococcales bacterium]|nr:LysR family transcriptional regulator [Myxococcales bacterium]